MRTTMLLTTAALTGVLCLPATGHADHGPAHADQGRAQDGRTASPPAGPATAPGVTVPPTPAATQAEADGDDLGKTLGEAGRKTGRALERAGETAADAAREAGEATSDAWITTKVKSKLAADPLVKAHRIDVDTDDHVVTLTGSVPTARARTRALEVARATDGVRQVIDRLRVGSLPAER